MVKPDPKIYSYLLDYYKLSAGKTVFIDDTARNLEAASKLGIHTIQFKNASQCEKELNNLVLF